MVETEGGQSKGRRHEEEGSGLKGILSGLNRTW